ncbi:hypothetical protein ACIQGZ_16630 [Streptomyces sp. NPDC092296]|uniref:hypothetical protein n=1 Tax=Streptomyces sp. NPDC092296 TaxID=3366012 RepID=UPI0038026E9A
MPIRLATVLLTAGAAVLLCPAAAGATTVVGAGNGTSDNNCLTVTGRTTRAWAAGDGGGAGGLAVSLPGSVPTNQCGNLGIGDTADGRTAGPVGETLHGLLQALKGEK